MSRYDSPTDRPQEFDLNLDCNLGKGLVFAGLGRFPKTAHYRDSSPYGNHGTLTDMAVPATATSGWAWDNYLRRMVCKFDGSNDYINLGATLSVAHPLFLSSILTIACWHKSAGDYTTAQALVANFASDGNKSNYALVFGYTDNKYGFWNYSGGGDITNSTAISTDAWRHIAVTRSGGTGSWPIALFLNGVADGTGTYTENPNATVDSISAIGRAGGYPTGYRMNGYLTDVCLWNRALSLSEIRQLADPSNYLLSGLILPPRRRLFAAGVAATGNRRRRLLITGAYR